MAKSAKSKPKALPGTPTLTTKSPSSSSKAIPEPYSLAPASLAPFLDILNPSHIYLTHVDTHPAAFKRKVFIVPVLLNIALVIGLGYRAYHIMPYYASLLMTMWGYDTEYKVNHKATGWNALVDETANRTFVLILDVMLASIVGPWPFSFFLGAPENPTSWRSFVGFKDKEVVVRRSRRWDEKMPTGSGGWWAVKPDDAIYKERIAPAVQREWLRGKTGYMMMDKSWDLDFEAMVKAHGLIEDGENKIAEFKTQVFVFSEDHGWLVWKVWEIEEGEGEGQKKVVLFKEKLTAMGKENLFFRWVELMQFETSRPGGFTEERQREAMGQGRKLFVEQGVDFDQFWKEVGGVEGMPGMETTN